MTQIEVNNVAVELKPQERQSFAQLANTLLPGMIAGKKIIELLCSVVAEGSKRGVEATHPTFQASLWAMHQIGVRGVRINLETNNADLRTEKSTEFEKQPFESHFTQGNIATGRALVATLLYFTNRSIRINNVVRPVVPQPLEAMKQVNQAVTQSRLAGEDVPATAAKYFLKMVEAGHADDSKEIQTAVHVLADCSVSALSYDIPGKSITIEGFSEANACAIAYLQGFDPQQIEQMHQRIVGMNARMRGEMPPAQAMPVARRRRS
ncbi:MAG: hypothetical protein K8R92_07195 [Planctomycetes bacterium]|nr:hypothetical protein [Planctomycetota bacterium]